MTPQINALIEKIRTLESELDAELAKRRAELRIGLEHGRIDVRGRSCCGAIVNCAKSSCLICSAPTRWWC